MKITSQVRENRSASVVCLVTLPANGRLVTRRTFWMEVYIHGQRTNSVLDTRDGIFSPQQWVPGEGPRCIT